MVPVALSDVIAVGEVPTAEEIDILAKAGFRSLLLTQPDGEVDRLPSRADVETKATAAGLAFKHIPVLSRRPAEPVVTEFHAALDTLPRPIYACCYSGARTAAAWALAASRSMPVDAVMEASTAAGYDCSFLKPEIEARKAAATSAQRSANGTHPAANAATTGDPTPAAAAPEPAIEQKPIPAIQPSIILPRAATAGGFAVSG